MDLNGRSIKFIMSEWASNCCLTPTHQFSAISLQEQVNFTRPTHWVGFLLC
jgi:hypothetical protein